MIQVLKYKINILYLRNFFPILNKTLISPNIVYLDNASSSQKPKIVLDTLHKYYITDYSNIHRGIYKLSKKSTYFYENARYTVAKFINSASPKECIFTSGTTEAINIVVNSWGRKALYKGSKIVLTYMEHHANIVPWQFLAKEKGANILWLPITPKGDIDLQELINLLDHNVICVSLTHVSNTLGTINSITNIVKTIRKYSPKARILLDGAQYLPHLKVDVQALGVDWYTFSGHKLYGPTGIGVLWGKYSLLETMEPYKGGGEIIDKVNFYLTTFSKAPDIFEPGTPNISGAIGLSAALQFINELGYKYIESYEQFLLNYATQEFKTLCGYKIFGTSSSKIPIISFTKKNYHPSDIGYILNIKGISVRTGHHCTIPLCKYYGIVGTTRVSITFYNSKEDINNLIIALRNI